MNFVAKVERTATVVAARALLLCLVFSPPPATATEHAPGLRRDVPFTDHIHRRFGRNEGLPSDWIYDLVQTRDGYVWVATQNGIGRFDGLRFKVFNRANAPQLPSSDIRVLSEDSSDNLWIGTTGGLCRYRPGRPGAFETVDVFMGNSVHAIFEDSSKRLWVGTREETWVKHAGGAFMVVEDAPSLVSAICEGPDGALWLGAQSGLFRSDDAGFEQVMHARHAELASGTGALSSVRALLADDGGVWVGCGHGLMRIAKDGSYPDAGVELGRRRLNGLYASSGGTVYAATSSGLSRACGEGPFEDLPTMPRGTCVLEDREGGLWAGFTSNGGLHYFRNSKVEALLTEDRINSVFQDSDGDVWFGAYSGLHRLHAGKLRQYGVMDGLPDPVVLSIVEEPKGSLLVSTNGGLARLANDVISPVQPLPEQANRDVGAIFIDSDQAYWFAFRRNGGARRLKAGVLEDFPELAHGQVTWFHEDEQGLWIGHLYGLYRYVDGNLEEVKDPAFSQVNTSHFTCYHRARDGALWLGTSGGILRYQKGRFDAVTSRNGLAADYVDRIHEDALGRLWLAGRDGVFFVDLQQLHDVASGRRQRLVSQLVEPVRGVPISHNHPKAALAEDDWLWMAASSGVIRVPPTAPVEVGPPPVTIEEVRVDGSTLSAEGSCTFRSGRHRLAIDFAVPTFVNRHNVQVRWRLDGLDQDWIDAGDERVAYYTDLGPGAYQFRIIAAAEGVWNEEGAAIDFVVLPRWWERLDVRLAMAGGLLAVGLLYVRRRTQRFRRDNVELRREMAERKRAEQEAREVREELARISRAASMGEMATSIAHEVRQPLFAILTDAETALRLLKQEEPDLEMVEESLEGISLGGNRASEIIDRIRSLVRKETQPKQQLDLNRVVEDVLAFLQPELRIQRVQVAVELAEDLPPVLGNEVELQQVVLNLLMNGVQAMSENGVAARKLSIATRAAGQFVELAVSDVGEGLDDAQAEELFQPFFTTKSGGTGMGLAINRTIIQAHGGRIWAASNQGEGATFSFRLPSHHQAEGEETNDNNA